MMIAIKAGTLIDGGGGTPLTDAVILVDGEKISQVGASEAVSIPPEALVLDASGKTVMPGMIDGHLHVRSSGGTDNVSLAKLGAVAELIETTTLKSFVHVNQDLAAGFTTIADMSSPGYVAIALRDAINAGLVPGPRMRACGQGLCITGGHMDGTRYRPEVSIAGRTGIADSPWAFRQAARHQIKMGADCIKINICSSSHKDRHNPDAPYYQEMTFEEMEAVCAEAHKAYMRVFAHSAGGQGITDGILAGVDSLEHAHWITEEQADLMAEHGTYYVPTFVVMTNALAKGQKALGATDHSWNYLNRGMEAKWASLERVHKAGAKIAVGTDAGFRVVHGENAEELEMLVKGGLTPMEAIMAATSVGAEHLDMGDLVGSIEPGKYADIVVVDGDPLADITVLQEIDRIKVVMKGGEVVVERE
jgi:imidazolonepropionase-like amidohydrolase